MFKKILIAVDGSEPSNDAIITGCKLAGEQKAEVHLIHAPMAFTDVAVLGYGAASVPPTMKQIEAAAKKVLDAAVDLAKQNGTKKPIADTHYGQPAHVLVDYATKNDIDLIVMGRRGHGTIASLLVGSVTNKVQQLAPCAVLTVK